MTINMLFFTIIIKQNPKSRVEAVHQEQIKEFHEQNVDRMLQLSNVMQNKVW